MNDKDHVQLYKIIEEKKLFTTRNTFADDKLKICYEYLRAFTLDVWNIHC